MAKLIKIKINNRNYGSIASIPLFITPELTKALEDTKKRDGTNLYSNLLTRGFQGGKHLMEMLRQKFGAQTKIVLSHKPSSISNGTVTIHYESFNRSSRGKFFAVYRETGLQTATDFLTSTFPTVFKDSAKRLPPRKAVKDVFGNLPEAVGRLSKKDQKQLPGQLTDLLANQDPNFVYTVLKSLEGASARTKLALQELLAKISGENDPARALQDLSDFMEKWSLQQVTSLLGILRARLHTIETFEEMIHNEKTYEIRGDKSIHRVLEKAMWLIDDKYWIVQSNKSLREFVGQEFEKKDKKYEKRRPDFACATYGNKLLLIEIKKPSIELKKKELDQLEDYQLIVRKYKGQKYSSIEPYLVGNKISDEARERASLRGGINIWTYQDLLEKCRNRYNEYLKVIEGEA